METANYYEIREGNGLVAKDGKFKFETKEDAINYAKAFKADPKIYNPKMRDEDVFYWKHRHYQIVHVVTATSVITLI